MTHRRYLTDDVPPWTPTPKGTYSGGTTGAIYRMTGLQTSRRNTIARAETSTSSTFDMLMMVVMTLIENSGTIAVNDTAQMWLGRQASATASFRGYLGQVWVSQGQTNTMRGTALATAAVGGSDWATTPEQTNVGATRLTSSTAVTAGDWLIFEFGARATNTTATSRTATMHYGGMGGSDISGVQSAALPANDDPTWMDITGTWESCFNRLPELGSPALMAA